MPCPFNCLNCTYNNSLVSCVTCRSNFTNNGSECLSSCLVDSRNPKDTWYSVNGTQKCLPCAGECETCFNSS